tara:strand:+ start:1279 stop:1467 length:189 start_codon:yes stop_codon:yes gene_type:complete
MENEFLKIKRRNKYQMAIDNKFPELHDATLKAMSNFFKERLPNNRLEAQKYIYYKYIINDGK